MYFKEKMAMEEEWGEHLHQIDSIAKYMSSFFKDIITCIIFNKARVIK